MHTEFRRVAPAAEIRSLVQFDRKVFTPADWFRREEWFVYESFWLLVNGRKVGCCAFDSDAEGFGKTLYIASTGIHPTYQGKGFGRLLKSWQIAYAREQGYDRMESHCRKTKIAILKLNKQVGFRIVRTIPHYYSDPDESAVVLELHL